MGEQPKERMATPQGPLLQVIIQYQPGTGAFQVGWPNVDPMTKYAMLEGARVSLDAEVISGINAAKSGIVMPTGIKLA